MDEAINHDEDDEYGSEPEDELDDDDYDYQEPLDNAAAAYGTEHMMETSW